jgi:hypothetical protein
MKIRFDEVKITEGYDFTTTVGILIPENSSDAFIIKKILPEGQHVPLFTPDQLNQRISVVESSRIERAMKEAREAIRRKAEPEPEPEPEPEGEV